MINYLKLINPNFALGLKACKKYAQNTLVVNNVGKHLQQCGKVKTNG